MVPYSDYKPSDSEWLDRLPEAWDELPCRAIVEHVVEKNHDGKVQNYLSLMANVGVIPYEDKGDVGNKKPDDLTKCKVVSVGDLVINSMNYAIGSYGMSPYYGVCSPVYLILRPDRNKIDQQFALRIFQNPTFQKYIASFGNGILAHRSAIGWEDIKNAKVPVPSVHEQTQITTFLDRETVKIDRLIEKQQRLIKLLEEKRQAVISHTVTKGLNRDVSTKDSGVEWLDEVPKHWEITKLKLIAEKITDGEHISPTFTDSGMPFLSAKDIRDRHIIYDVDKFVAWKDGFKFRQRCNPEHGDILIVSRGATIGRIGLVEKDDLFCLLGSVILVKPKDQIDSIFLFYLLNQNSAKEQFLLASQSSAQQAIYLTDVATLCIALPPIVEQVEISKWLEPNISKLNALKEKAESCISILQERRSALISAAVTGKIDVRDQVPQDVEEAVVP